MKPVFPYRLVFGDFNLLVHEVRVDGDVPDVPVINLGVPEVDVRDVERSDWNSLDLAIEVSAPVAGIAKADVDHAPIGVTVSLNDRATNTRIAVVLDRSVADPALWAGTLRVRRSLVRGSATLEAVLTGTVDGYPCRVLRRAPHWDIVLDASIPRPVDGALPVKWAEFDEVVDPDHPLLHKYEHEAFFIDLEAETPIVYLNSSMPHLLDVMGDRDRTDKADVAMHQVQRTSLAARIWGGLFESAAAEAVRINEDLVDGEEPEWPDSWRRDVLTRLLGHIYDSSTPDDALLKLIDTWKQPGGSALTAEVIAAAEIEGRSARGLREAAEAVYKL